MTRLLARLLVNAAALLVAAWLLPGITVTAFTDLGSGPVSDAARNHQTLSTVLTLVVVAAIFGVVNAVVKPVAKLVGLGLIILTLGLMLFVINALMLLLTSWIAGQLGVPFHVDGFWTAVLGGIILSIVSSLLGGFVPRERH